MKKLLFILCLFFGITTLISQEYIAAVEKDKKWGYIDEKGNWIIEPRLDKANDFNEGYAIVEINDTKHYVDVKGKFYGKLGEYEIFHNFSEGLARVRVGDYWGFIDTSFSIVIQPAYNNAKDFSEGVASVKQMDLWGFIDRSEWIVHPAYLKAYTFQDGLAMVKKDDGWYFLDKEGELYGDPRKFRIKKGFIDGLALIEQNDKFGYIDREFNVVIDAIYDGAKNFSEGIARVKQGEKWGYINKKGEWLKEPVYEKAYEFRCGIAMVKIEKTWYYIDKDFNQISNNSKFRVTHLYSNGLAKVKVGKLWGYVNTKGETVIEPVYNSVRDFKKISP